MYTMTCDSKINLYIFKRRNAESESLLLFDGLLSLLQIFATQGFFLHLVLAAPVDLLVSVWSIIIFCYVYNNISILIDWWLLLLIEVYTYSNWSWSQSSWIYSYLCNQCLSSLSLWVQTPLRRGALDTSSSVTCGRSVLFSGFLHQ